MRDLELLFLNVDKAGLAQEAADPSGHIQRRAAPRRCFGGQVCPAVDARALRQAAVRSLFRPEVRRNLDALEPAARLQSSVGLGQVHVPVGHRAVRGARMDEVEGSGLVEPSLRKVVHLKAACRRTNPRELADGLQQTLNLRLVTICWYPAKSRKPFMSTHTPDFKTPTVTEELLTR